MVNYTNMAKVPSALITNNALLEYARKKNDYFMFSTGMSTEEEIEACINACNPDVIMHTNSTYPCPVEDLNLRNLDYDFFSTSALSDCVGPTFKLQGHELSQEGFLDQRVCFEQCQAAESPVNGDLQVL